MTGSAFSRATIQRASLAECLSVTASLVSSPTPFLIRLFRCLRLAVHFVRMTIGTVALYPGLDAVEQRRLKQRWSRRLLDILCVHLEIAPALPEVSGLIVANHVSWLDIFVINASRPAAFVSKSEIRYWPLIGWLAARNETVFLRRGSHGHARIVNTEIDAMLTRGQDVALFPEGTTTDGTHLLGFHAALLQPAVETGCPIIPVAISYHDAAGELTLAPAFTGNITLARCFARILACRSLIARITPTPALASNGKHRRELVQAAHQAIANALATRRGLPLPGSSPE